jgi:hypothetical protein
MAVTIVRKMIMTAQSQIKYNRSAKNSEKEKGGACCFRGRRNGNSV